MTIIIRTNFFINVLFFSFLFFYGCKPEKKIIKISLNYLINDVLNESNYKDNIKIYYKFDNDIDIDVFVNDSILNNMNFDFSTFENQNISFENTKISSYLDVNDSKKIEINKYNVSTNECLFFISPPFFSKNKKYILFLVKYLYLFDKIYHWSYTGIILKNENDIIEIETSFLNDKIIKNSFNNAIFDIVGGSLFLFNYKKK